MVKTVVVIRHGETTANKTDPKRGLTDLGAKKTNAQAEKIKAIIGTRKTEIVCTKTTRSIESAEILSSILDSPIRAKKYDLRVDRLYLLESSGDELILEKYINATNGNKLPAKVPSPKTVARRFLGAIVESEPEVEVLVVVSHSIAIEAFLRYQSVYSSDKKTINSQLDYSDFVVLERSDL